MQPPTPASLSAAARDLLLHVEATGWRALRDTGALRELHRLGLVELHRRPGQLPAVRLTGAGGSVVAAARRAQGLAAPVERVANGPEARAVGRALEVAEDVWVVLDVLSWLR